MTARGSWRVPGGISGFGGTKGVALLDDHTIGGMLKPRVEKYGDRVMMRHKVDGSWKDISWNEFYDKVQKLGLALISSGIHPGDRVAIFSPNSPYWQMVDLATVSIGAADVPLYATITPRQAEYIIKDSGAKIVFVGTEDHMNRVLEVRDALPELKKIVTLDNTTSSHPDVITFEDMLKLGAKNANPDEFEKRLEAVDPMDLATIIYTSGTTGDPKGVMLLHNNLMSNVITASAFVEVDDTDVCLSFLPLSHSLERMSGFYTAIYNGVTICHAQGIDQLIDDIAEIKPHFMVSVPRLYEKVYAAVLSMVDSEPPLKQKVFKWATGVGREMSQLTVANKKIPVGLKIKHKIANKLVFAQVYQKMGGRMRFFFSGGAPLAREIAEFFHAMGVVILEGFGLTETSPVLTVNRPWSLRFGSVGQALPDVTIKIADDGEILAKGPNVMKGYWNRPEESAEALEGGWFHTGDIGHLDEDGFLFITDRKKDLIVTAGGKNIAPQNIENTLKLDKYVEQVAVIGDKRKFISALIVPTWEELEVWAKGQGIDCSDRAAACADERINKMMKERVDKALVDFDRHERVMKFVLLPEEMTEESGLLTPTLKVKRKEVTSRYEDLIEGMYT